MKIILIAVALVLAALPLRARQWTQTPGPEGGEIVSMASVGIILLAVTTPGVLHRHNGAEWERLGATDAQRLYSIGNTFIAVSYDAVSRSTDQGAHWERAPLSGTSFKLVVDGGMLYAAADDSLYRSADEGRTWSAFAHPGMGFYSLYVSGPVVMLGRGEGAGLYRSGDSGRSWSHVDAGLPAGVGADLFQRIGGSIYAAFGPFGVYRSNDAGLSWSPMNEGFTNVSGGYPPISSFLAMGERLWAASREGIYLHDGTRWMLKARSIANTLAKGDGFLYHGSNLGVAATTDSGMSWFSLDRTLNAHRVGALAAFDGAIYASGGGGIHMTTDNGLSWDRVAIIAVDRFAVGDGAIYALGRSTVSPGIFRATAESPWTRISDSLPYNALYLSALSASGDTLFAGYHRAGWDSAQYWRYGGIHRSTDRGATWSAVNTGLPNDGHGFALIDDIIQAGGAVLAMTADGLYRSTNGGESWSRVDVTLPNGNDYGIFAKGGGRVYLAGSTSVIASSDGGRSWSGTGPGLLQSGLIHHLQFIRGVLHATVSDGENIGRLFRLVDDHWVEITDRLPAGIPFETFIESGEVVLGGTQWRGVWRGSLDAPAGIDDGGDESAGDLSASPNPFTSGTSIGFSLDRGGSVRLSLLSPAGEEAGTIFEGMLPAGAHRFGVDGAGLASGAYRIRLAADGRVRSVGVVKVR
jgi:hypothetical protein